MAGRSYSNPVTSSSITVPVNWEIATDPMINQIVDRGVANASANRNWTIKVGADGLNEGTNYYYRFSHGSGAMQAVSATRESKTLPAAPSQVRFAVLSCANFKAEEAFLAYGRVLEMHRQDPYDAILFLGDYIYEYGEGGYTAAESAKEARGFIPDHDVVTLDDYRAR
jgi:phosphodiesterase/alkaline phosphatase D-like protein